MTGPYEPLSELDLLAYADGLLDPARQALVEAFLESHPLEARRIADYMQQNRDIRAHFAAAPAEATPDRFLAIVYGAGGRTAARNWSAVARGLAVGGALAVAGVTGWWFGRDSPDDGIARFVDEIAHAALSAGEESLEAPASGFAGVSPLDRLSRELASDFNAGFAPPGFQVIGQQQLWRNGQEIARFEFRDDNGRDYSVFVTTRSKYPGASYAVAEGGGRRIAYWADGPAMFAVSGNAEPAKLVQFAKAIDRAVCTEDQSPAETGH
jgi:anti-sigma factor RsiW